MTKINVLYISHARQYSGAEIALMNLIRDNTWWNVCVMVPEGDFAEVLKKNHINVIISKNIRALERSSNKLWFIGFLRRFAIISAEIFIKIRKISPDIIHSNHLSSTLYCIIPSLLCRKKLVWHMHDIRKWKSLEGLAAFVFSLFSEKIIAVSDAVAESLRNCHISEKKIVRCWNGIDEQSIADMEPLDTRYYFKNNAAFNIAHISLIEKRKGIDVFVNAISLLHREKKIGNNTNFYIVGDTISESDYKNNIKKLIQTEFLENIVHMAGRLKSMRTVYQNTDIVVLASIDEEPFGLVLIEAMLMGCFVIASKTGGIPEIIRDEYNGLLFEPGNYFDLAEKIKLIINQEIDTEKIKLQAKDTVNELFTIKAQISCLDQIYKSLVSRK